MQAGYIGLGRLGRAMAERLEASGVDLVVWNRSPEKAEGLKAQVADTPRAVAEARDVILCCLGNDEALETVYFGEGGLLSGPLDGKLVIEMTTTAPETSERLAEAVTGAGGQFLECPVGGTIAPALQGQLLGLAGGTAEAFAAGKPVLDLLCRRLEHVGPVGSGAAMKLSINLPLMVYWAALGEALGLALGRGIDPGLALDILADSSGAIGAAKKRVPPIREMLESGAPGGVNFALDVAIKDMGLMEALAAAQGRASPVISATRARAQAAQADGFGGIDASMVGLHGFVAPKVGG